MQTDKHRQKQDLTPSIGYDIREILIDDAAEYKRIRLEALKLNPSAFAENTKDFEKKTLEEINEESVNNLGK